MFSDSRGNSFQQKRGEEQKPSFGKNNEGKQGNTDVIKASPKSSIPKQCSSNNATAQQATDDDEVQTFMGFLGMCSRTFNMKTVEMTPTVVEAHTHYLCLFKDQNGSHLCIVDGGADSHVGGVTWLVLTDVHGPCVK